MASGPAAPIPASPTSPASTQDGESSSRSYVGPLVVLTSLFFMWGFLTCLNDILIPHLKAMFTLSYAKVMPQASTNSAARNSGYATSDAAG